MQDQYQELARAIISYQESLIGPLAWAEASKVKGVTVSGKSVEMTGRGEEVLSLLVSQYENLFGKASVEACKDAIRPLLPRMKKELVLPQNLLH